MHSNSVIRVFVSVVFILGLWSGSPVRASECEGLFPDFGCDRQVRPEGSVMPMSFPYLFEDPYIGTGLNLVGIWHQFPNDSIMQGGDMKVLALQARLAITDRLAFIATKDGYAFTDPDNPLLDDEQGSFNITAGFKYAVWEWSDEHSSAILTPSLRYEIPMGNRRVYQGAGDGTFIPAVSGAYQHGNWHVVGDLGGQAPIDRDENSSSLFYNLHVDHSFPTGFERVDFIVPFIELSGIVYTGNGDGSQKVKTNIGTLSIGDATAALGLSPFEGVDVINLGSNNVRGNNIMTMAWGVRLPLGDGLNLGLSYERPISNRKDLWEQRATAMLTWEM